MGTPVGTLLCYAMIGILNLISIRSLIPNTPAIVRNLIRSALAAAGMGLAVYAVYYLLNRAGIGSSVLLCGVPIVVGVVVYVVAVVMFKAITRDDCLLLPKGEKIANLLHL